MKSLSVVPGQQQHFFDTRLTYHSSRSAAAVGVAAMGAAAAGYNWGYNNYSSYLGYGAAAGAAAAGVGVSPYQTAGMFFSK